LSWVFLVNDDRSNTLSFSLNKNIDYSAPILFVPLSPTLIEQKKIAVINQPTPFIVPIKKAGNPPTTIAPLQPVKQIVPVKTDVQKAGAQISSKVVGKQVEKQIAPEKKQIKEVAKPQFSDASKKNPEPQRIIPENAQISHDYREVKAMRRTALLQKELANSWKPPVGVPPSVMCEIECSVDINGRVKEITMKKSSEIMMYDLSARHAVFVMKMPQWTYGKTISIVFKQ